jgi:hypothetical protein
MKKNCAKSCKACGKYGHVQHKVFISSSGGGTAC